MAPSRFRRGDLVRAVSVDPSPQSRLGWTPHMGRALPQHRADAFDGRLLLRDAPLSAAAAPRLFRAALAQDHPHEIRPAAPVVDPLEGRSRAARHETGASIALQW